ncbi:DUF2268 domain-containing putative Zn-dependent protease [Psychrobacillus sp. FSL H8-0483]|uniref:DUF2268 domain-containing protein n=1 Tax=Psychrobacillus sp. FSL H8-0483 TaxID=2921389 RepID=UPI00315A1359
MKRIVGLVIFVSVLFASCSDDIVQDKEEENNLPSQKEVSFSYEGKNFKIIPFYEEVLEYTDYVKKNPSESNPGAYVEKVLKPLKEKSSLDLPLEYPFTASTEVEQFEKNTVQLLQKQEQINELIQEALIKSAEQLPGGDKNIYIMPLRPEDNFAISKMEGVNGVTYNDKDIFIQIDTSISEDKLKYLVAHEYHHAINILANGERAFYTVLDMILSEGKADSFAHIVYPEISAPWTEPLSEESTAIVLEELRKNADSTSVKIYKDFFHGNSAKGIPLWSDYKIGYEITQSYIENNPDTSISKWTRLSSKELLQNSEYNNLLK